MTAKDNSLFVIKDATVLKQNNHPPNGFIDILTMVFSAVWGFLLALANSLLGLDILIVPKQNLQSSSNETKESNETNETTNKKETDLKDDLKEIGKDDSKETGKDETVEELSSVISSPPMSVSSSTSSVLFPQRSNFISSLTNSNSNLNECSTGPESQLFSFTNKNGELEWSLMDNNSKSSLNLDPNYHQLSPISDSSTHSPNNNKQQQPQQDQQHDTKSTNPIYGFVSLSPISSIKSTGSSHMSGNESNTTNPTTTNNSPNVSSGNDDDMSPHNDKMVSSSASEGEDDEDEKENGKSTIFKGIKKEFVSTPNSSKASDDDEEDIEGDVVTDEKGNKVHQCPYCDSKFRMRGYLTRHIKKHNSEKAYRCPYYNHDSTQKCHVTGGFSRRDTYKTHLKSRHFKYPPGIKSGDRIGMMGWCGICGEKFANNEIWVERHIERGLCSGLTEEYIKTLKIGKKKTGKHSRLLDVEDQPNMQNANLGGMVNMHSNGSNSPANAKIITTTGNDIDVTNPYQSPDSQFCTNSRATTPVYMNQQQQQQKIYQQQQQIYQQQQMIQQRQQLQQQLQQQQFQQQQQQQQQFQQQPTFPNNEPYILSPLSVDVITPLSQNSLSIQNNSDENLNGLISKHLNNNSVSVDSTDSNGNLQNRLIQYQEQLLPQHLQKFTQNNNVNNSNNNMNVNPLGQLNECFSYPISTFSRSNEKITNYDNNGSNKNANFNDNQPNGSKNADNDEEEEFQSLDEENCCYANETHLKNDSNSLNTNSLNTNSNNNASSNQDNDSNSSSNLHLQNKNDDVYNLFKDIGVVFNQQQHQHHNQQQQSQQFQQPPQNNNQFQQQNYPQGLQNQNFQNFNDSKIDYNFNVNHASANVNNYSNNSNDFNQELGLDNSATLVYGYM